jgi:ABC-type phosphate transport system substrate-binding protein
VTIEAARTPTRPARRRLLAGLAALLALAAGAPRPAAAADFVVVINAANPQASLPAAEVSNMFLQKTHQWGSGERVRAVDLPESSAARESFSRAIHGRPTSAVKAYWQRMIFSGVDTPPPEKLTPADVLAYVKANPGAIGYVPAGTPLPDGVKALKVAP